MNDIVDTGSEALIVPADGIGAAGQGGENACRAPALPRTVRDTGIDKNLLAELAAKLIYLSGKIRLPALSSRLKLSVNVVNELLGFMVAEHLAEVTTRGSNDVDVEYQLTEGGKARAAEFLTRCRYVGPAPVTLDAYRAVVARQSVRMNRISRSEVMASFADLTLDDRVRDYVGAAMNSGRPLFLYGPAGSGKTYLAERLSRLMRGVVAIPYAIALENEIIQVFDPLVHLEDEDDSGGWAAHLADRRWVRCRRPVVLTGGELTLDLLDLRHDRTSGFYQAPPHVKANGGIFIVDDLGRQKMAPRDLMNRWIVPLDRGHDHLALHTGHKFAVPFDVAVVFSTNLRPGDLADEAFLRRLGYKIHVGPLTETQYEAVLRKSAATLEIGHDPQAFRFLVDGLHRPYGRPLLACYPRDLLSLIVDHARYTGEAPRMTEESLRRAWHSYFAEEERHEPQTA